MTAIRVQIKMFVRSRRFGSAPDFGLSSISFTEDPPDGGSSHEPHRDNPEQVADAVRSCAMTPRFGAELIHSVLLTST